MKIIGKLLLMAVVLLAFPLSVLAKETPKPSQKPLEVNSFEMFWPIVAGKTEGDKLYKLKLLKEKARGSLIFSNLKKSEYNILLSQKRLLEYEKLVLVDKDYTNSKKTLDLFNKTTELAVSQLKKAKEDGMDVNATLGSMQTTFEKETTLLQSILTKVDESQKNAVSESISHLNSVRPE